MEQGTPEYNPDAACVIEPEEFWLGTDQYNISAAAFAKAKNRGDGFIGTYNGINLFLGKKESVQLPPQIGIRRRV